MLQIQTGLQTKLDDFIAAAQGETGLPLIIAHSDTQLATIAHYLTSKGFHAPATLDELMGSLGQAGSYYTLLVVPHKALYDAIVQYPMGQIQLTKPNTLEPILITPNYDSGRILLVTNHHLDAWARLGYDLLRATGVSLRLEPADA